MCSDPRTCGHRAREPRELGAEAAPIVLGLRAGLGITKVILQKKMTEDRLDKVRNQSITRLEKDFSDKNSLLRISRKQVGKAC